MYRRLIMVFGKMYWIYLVCMTAVSCTMLQYDSRENKLTVRCPGDMSRLEGGVEVDSYKVQHVADNGLVTDFIDMTTSDDPKAKNKVGQRIQFRIDPDNSQLIGEVSNAGCYDSGLYKCVVLLYSKTRSYHRSNYSERFHFPGSKPSISTPEKSCFQVGDVLQLNCSSRGPGLVWEASGQKGSFLPLSSASPVQQNSSGDCATPLLLPLRHVIRSEDNGRIFRCKVQGSDYLAAQVTVAVDCGQGCSATTPTPASRSSLSRSSTAITSSSPAAVAKDGHGALGQGNDDVVEHEVRADQVRSQPGEAASSQTGQTAMVAVVACACVLIIVILLVILWRQKQQRSKHLQPLVVVDSSPPSEYSATLSERKLPNLPHLDQWLPAAGNTTPKWVADQQLGSDDDSIRAQRDTNASIYVSMDNLHRDKSGLADHTCQANGDCSQRSTTTPEPEVQEPDMRSNRSESLYSNSEAVDREAAARARALVQGV